MIDLNAVLVFFKLMFNIEFFSPLGWLNILGLYFIFRLLLLKLSKQNEQLAKYKEKGVVSESIYLICLISLFFLCAALLTFAEIIRYVVYMKNI